MSNEVAIVEENLSSSQAVEQSLASIGGDHSTKVVSTFVDVDEETALEVFAAVSDAEQLEAHLGEIIALENVVFQAIVIEDQITKEPVDLIRTILLTADGAAYATTSTSVFKSLETMFAILGKPHTWKAAKEVVVISKKAKLGSFYSLVPVTKKMREAATKK